MRTLYVAVLMIAGSLQPLWSQMMLDDGISHGVAATVLAGNGEPVVVASDSFSRSGNRIWDWSMGQKFKLRSREISSDVDGTGLVHNTRFRVEPVQVLNSAQTDIVACRHAHDLYFYSRARRHHLGNPLLSASPKRRYSLYSVPEGLLGTGRKVRIVSRAAFDSQRSLGLVWDRLRNIYYVTKEGQTGQQGARIYCSQAEGTKFVREEMLDLKSDSSANDFHPSLSPNGELMVFASDRAGGFGGVDLWWSVLQGDHWSTPLNLGSFVNTAGNETYPAFNDAGILYYASDSMPGFGGTDIYVTSLRDSAWSAAVNAGPGINSAADDFGLIWNDPSQGPSGYFSSNRNPQSGNDIYEFSRQPEFWGTVVDSERKLPLSFATVRMREAGKDWRALNVDARGEFFSYVDPERSVEIEVQAPGYPSQVIEISTAALPQGADCRFEVPLTPIRSYWLDIAFEDSVTGMLLDSVSVLRLEKRSGVLLTSDSLLAEGYNGSLDPGLDYVLIVRRKGYRSEFVDLPLADFYGQREDVRSIKLAPKAEMLLVGCVTDSVGKPLLGPSQIDVVDLASKKVLQSFFTDASGGFSGRLSRSIEGKISLFASHAGSATTHIHLYRQEDQYFSISLPAENMGFALPSMKLYYGLGKTYVVGNQTELIDDIYFYMLRNPDINLELRTYTDSTGSFQFNEEISRKRSAAIMTELVLRGGIDIERISRKDYGERYQVVAPSDIAGAEYVESRRTEVYFYRVEWPVPQAAK